MGARAVPRVLTDPALALMVAAQAWDAATFGMAEASRAGVEVNPLMAGLYAGGGFGAVALAKALATLGMLAVVVTYRRRMAESYDRPAAGRGLALVVAALGVFGALTNVLAML